MQTSCYSLLCGGGSRYCYKYKVPRVTRVQETRNLLKGLKIELVNSGCLTCKKDGKPGADTVIVEEQRGHREFTTMVVPQVVDG